MFIHPASRGGPPTPTVFWFGPCKDIEHTSTIFLQCFLIVFLQHPRNLYIFGHKVGPKKGSYSVVSIFSSKTTKFTRSSI